ncbi:MAG: histidine--tRNA ligase [Verrucomicrobiota bacterium]
MADKIQTLPGFRDFYPEDCAARNYLFGKWRAVAHRYGFLEYEAPLLEATDLYKRKSGEEITTQLFCFEDKSEREVSLRPELTPSLARMAAARQRDYKKPLRWFAVGRFFRYEKPQKGRTREFYQLNCDILGEPSAAADAELIAFAIDLMRSLGFTADDFVIRLSDRQSWNTFLEKNSVSQDNTDAFLQIIDKWEREPAEKLAPKLEAIGIDIALVRAFMESSDQASDNITAIQADLAARGYADYIQVDLAVVRGLAYYTGAVYEVFDKSKSMRAVAGGGRYDSLVKLIGGVDMPACGFAMGDVVISDFIRATPRANAQLEEALGSTGNLDAYVVIADESQRPAALAEVQKLRESGYRIDYPLTPTKIAKQFQAAEQLNARATILFGDEFPLVKIKDLTNRAETAVPADNAFEVLQDVLANEEGPLLADSP